MSWERGAQSATFTHSYYEYTALEKTFKRRRATMA